LNNTNNWEKIRNDAKKYKKDSKKITRYIILGIIIFLVILIVSSMWYTVNDQQKAVVTTFGKVTSVEGAGLHLKIPGVQHATLVDVNVIRSIDIGYRTDKSGNTTAIEIESKMITGDYNIVNIDFYVEYQISDPEKYLYASEDPEELLKLLIQSQIRSVVGSLKVDNVITDGKAQLETSVYELSIAELSTYDIGLKLNAIRIQDSEPPTDDVKEAFAAVINAGQKRQTLLNQASQYEAEKQKLIDAETDKLIKQAEYEKVSRINEANKQVAMFNAMYGQYILNRDITKTRMYYEALEDALDGVTLYIDTGDGTLQKLLPIDTFVDGSNN